jgi:hypothetical protein
MASLFEVRHSKQLEGGFLIRAIERAKMSCGALQLQAGKTALK